MQTVINLLLLNDSHFVWLEALTMLLNNITKFFSINSNSIISRKFIRISIKSYFLWYWLKNLLKYFLNIINVIFLFQSFFLWIDIYIYIYIYIYIHIYICNIDKLKSCCSYYNAGLNKISCLILTTYLTIELLLLTSYHLILVSNLYQNLRYFYFSLYFYYQ